MRSFSRLKNCKERGQKFCLFPLCSEPANQFGCYEVVQKVCLLKSTFLLMVCKLQFFISMYPRVFVFYYFCLPLLLSRFDPFSVYGISDLLFQSFNLSCYRLPVLCQQLYGVLPNSISPSTSRHSHRPSTLKHTSIIRKVSIVSL